MSWLDDHPEITTICTAVADLNGQARGKRMPVDRAGKMLKGEARMPLSALNVDILGHDIEDSPLVFETGDMDGALRPTERGPVAMPWLSQPAALIPMWMFTTDGVPFDGDPRHALQRVLDRYAARGWHVVAATEVEFYLFDPDQSPQAERLDMGGEVLSLQALDAYDEIFSELYAAARQMDIPADTVSSESGAGQYEINLVHGPAMKAADDAWLFKMLIRGIARRHDMDASFMAKPSDDMAGTGMHVHFSVLDTEGRNIFDDGGPDGTPVMRHAVAGCLEAMQDATLIFAPHQNSYNRLVPGAHAPTGVCWAYENRTAALRIPDGPGPARRIEHRVAGGDTNPYLLLAAILGGALEGIEAGKAPPAPLEGNAYDQDLPTLPAEWDEAIERFENSPAMAAIFPEELIRNLVMTKRQESAIVEEMSEEDLIALYMDRV